ncbi:hypothetical protein LCGC14_3048410 [marine sediment metagenome]|uniref:Uncharacterized protein n=1 Tax=marine sediment metagenome TaxID=412755 RepID=A0A0F8XAP0_9ZZZZ
MSFPRALNQVVTHWGTTPDGFGGFAFTAPAALNGRWQKKREVIDRFGAGQEYVSTAQVFIDVDIIEGDYLFEGVSTDTDPTLLDGARRIEKFEKLPDLRNLDHQRKAYL